MHFDTIPVRTISRNSVKKVRTIAGITVSSFEILLHNPYIPANMANLKLVYRKGKTSKVSKRAIKRITNGNSRTNDKIRALKAAWSTANSISPPPGFMEPAERGKYWCQMHAINNCLGYALVTMEAIEDARRKSKTPVPTGGPSGFWHRPFFLDTLQTRFKLRLQRAKIVTGTDPQFMKILADKIPSWQELRFFVYLQYDTKYNLSKTERSEVLHAVAIRDGLVYDADYGDRVFPLADYPLRFAITTLYTITARAP